MAEKDPKKETYKETRLLKKPAAKKEEIKETKTAAKATLKRTAAKPAPDKKAVKDSKRARKKRPKKVPDAHKMEESPDESKIEAAKFYPAQMKEKNGKAHEEL